MCVGAATEIRQTTERRRIHGSVCGRAGLSWPMLYRILSLAERYPCRFAVGYGGAKTVAADILVQQYVERRELDRRRSAIFLLFGFVQVGFVQYQLYVNAFTRIFPSAASFAAAPLATKLKDTVGLRNVAFQVGLDQFVYHPLCYFPVFYVCQELVRGEPASPVETVRNAITAYRPNAVEDLKALWSVFVPVSIMQFSIMPMHLRVPFAATFGFVWCGILSCMRGAEVKKVEVVAAESKVS